MFASRRAEGQPELRSWGVRYRRMPIEVESPEQLGYDTITNNLSESSVADRRLADLGIDFGAAGATTALDALLLCYGDHLGDPVLREAVAAGGEGLRADDVIVTPGAATALFATATSLLEPGDHAVVVRTNYATNLETPRAIGAELDIVDLAFDEHWQLDVARVAARVRAGATRLISVTCPHNPTGTMLDLASLHALVELADRSGAVLLVDETYRDLTHDAALPMAATLSPRAISVSSMSKAYGLPGLRIGWAVCRDPQLAEMLLAAKEQIVICGATIDEAIAGRVLRDRARILPPILDDVRHRLAIVRDWIGSQHTFEWVEPRGGVVGLVRFAPGVAVDTARFYDVLLAEHGTYVGPGHWFEVDDRHFRLGFGWPSEDELRAGLAALSVAADDA
jgi:aspartate/methionine/tyrosine aminotransferase